MGQSSDHNGRRATLEAFMKLNDFVVRQNERGIAAATSHVAHAQRAGLDVLNYVTSRAQQLNAASKEPEKR